MSLPAINRSFQSLESRVRTSVPAEAPRTAAVLSFSLGQLIKISREWTSHLEALKTVFVQSLPQMRDFRKQLDGPEPKEPVDGHDVAVSCDDVLVNIMKVLSQLSEDWPKPISQRLVEAAPEFARRSADNGRLVRRLAGRVAEAESGVVKQRDRLVTEIGLLRTSIEAERDRAREIARGRDLPSFQLMTPAQAPDYKILQSSISRRFEKTLERLGQ